MSLLGVDVGTSGCKALVFSEQGQIVSSAHAEYDFSCPASGQAELDSDRVWEEIKRAVMRAAHDSRKDPVTAVSVCSLGEAVVPVSKDRRILGPSLLGFDSRGEEFLDGLKAFHDRERLYRLNGNSLGNNYGLTKLLWIKTHRPDLYEAAHRFLPWGSLVPYMMGADPIVDYSLANRMLVFDLAQRDWSDELLQAAGIDRDKLPATAAAGTRIGEVSRAAASELGLQPGTPILLGAHDQCANALGSGVIRDGQAMLGMGTYPCIVPVFSRL